MGRKKKPHRDVEQFRPGDHDRCCGNATNPKPPASAPVGDTLREERERRGLKVEEVAAATRIARHHIEAIERGQFDSVPGGAYRRSFLRQYAHLLGLNEHEIILSFLGQYQEPALELPKPPRERHAAPLGLLWVPTAIAALLGIYNLWHRDLSALPQTAKVNKMATATPPSGHADRVQESPAESPAAPPALEPAAVSAVHVGLSTIEPVWILVKCDGLESYSGTLEKSSVKQFDADKKMTALVGNAGGLRFSINGKNYGPMGIHGEILLLEFTADGPRVLNRRAPPKPRTSEETSQQER